jgi:hypothetical protein
MPITGEPVLMAEVGAAAAERVAALDDQALRAAALRTLVPFADPALLSPTATPGPSATPTP